MSFLSNQPATPGKAKGNNGSFMFAAEHPSTTPAGVPRSMASTTPAVPPPSTIFGSSQMGPGTGGLFKHAAGGSKPGIFKVSPRAGLGINRGAKSSGTDRASKPAILGAKRAQAQETDEEEYSDTEGDDDTNKEDGDGEDEDDHWAERSDLDAEGDEEEARSEDDDAEGEYSEEEEYSEDDEVEDDDEDGEAEDEEMEENRSQDTPKAFSKPRKPDFMQSGGAAFDWAGLAEEDSATQVSPKGLKRSRDFASASLIQSIEADLPPAKRRESTLPRIAKDLARTQGTATLDDPSGLILGTERVVKGLNDTAKTPRMVRDSEARLKLAFTQGPSTLARLWKAECSKIEQHDENINMGIGPAEDSHPATKAAFVASMLLALHHQPLLGSNSSSALQRTLASSTARLSLSDDDRKPYPRILLDVLEEQHNTYGQGLNAVLGYRPNSTAHSSYWDALVTATLRGRLSLMIQIIQRSDFGQAWTASDEGYDQGYQGFKVKLIERVVGQLSDVLQSAPGYKDGDWDVTGHDWSSFRKRVQRALDELVQVAEGSKAATNGTLPSAQNFGNKAPTPRGQYGQIDGQLPRSIYEPMKVIYAILLGQTAEIISASQDWLEATLGLAIWWNGEDEEGIPAASLKASRRSAVGRAHAGTQRIVDTDPAAAYRRRLALVVDIVTNGPESEGLMVDTNNSVEVALASVFEGNVEGVLSILQTWSIPITSAVLEFAKWGGWYESPPSDAPPEGFDDSDLMVLSFAKPDRGIVKDDLLLSYSDLLFEKGLLRSDAESKEGWELAIEVSSRLDDETAALKRIDWILTKVPVNTDEHADKLIRACLAHGLEKQARNVAKRHADYLSSTTNKYGLSIIYYAKAHEHAKCKAVLDLLVSMSLLNSSAYPIFEHDLNQNKKPTDSVLPSLLTDPKTVMEQLRLDDEAINVLTSSLSGYATLRRFYDLRDESVRPNAIGAKPSGLRPKAQRRAGAKALLACIASAASPITGGLYDKDDQGIIEVDVLLALLAEAAELLVGPDFPDHVLDMEQLMLLLRVIEDLQTVHPKIRAKCEDCFRTCLTVKFDLTFSRLDPKDMLKKSVSGLTESSGFSLVGTEITDFSEAGVDDPPFKEDSIERAWDWREVWSHDTFGDRVLEAMRRGIAEEIALLWIEGL